MIQYFSKGGGRGINRNLSSVDCISVNFMYCMPISDGACEYWLCSQLYSSPPQLCHTLNGTVGMLSSTGGSCRAALGSINFIAYFYNPPLCMRPPSHPIASALTVHTAVKFRVSPMFYGRPLLQSLPISLFASLAF